MLQEIANFSGQGVIGRRTFIVGMFLNIMLTLFAVFIILLVVALFDTSATGSGIPAIGWLFIMVPFALSGWHSIALIRKRNRDAFTNSIWVWVTIIGFFLFGTLWTIGIGILAGTKSRHLADPDIFGEKAKKDKFQWPLKAQPSLGAVEDDLAEMSGGDLVARAAQLRQAEQAPSAVQPSRAPVRATTLASAGFNKRGATPAFGQR